MLPTRDNLKRRDIDVKVRCLWCNEEESVDHELLHCQKAKEVWRLRGMDGVQS